MADVLRQALAQPPERVRALALPDGGRVWLKRIEQHSGRMRLQKGNAAKAFAAERDAMEMLSDAGLPVAAPLAAGPDFLVLPDLGPTLSALLDDPSVEQAERLAAFHGAGIALAQLHRVGYAHGRPALRDLCWRDGAVRMIDLERFRNRKRSPARRALDMVVFTHSWFARPNAGTELGPEMRAALSAWQAEVPEQVSNALSRVMRLLRPLGMLARLVLRYRPNSRDWRAVLATLEALPPR